MSMFIYVMKCPASGEVRYVGKALNLKTRLRQHVHEARSGAKNHRCAWIRKVLETGQRPVIEAYLELQSSDCWKAAERTAIARFRALGCKLTNSTAGGDGEGPLPDDVRDELSRGTKEYFASPGARARHSEMMKRFCEDPDWLAERTAAMKASRSTPEWKAAQSERSKALWADPAYREKMRTGRAKLYADPVYRAKLSVSNRKSHADPEFRQRKADKARAAWARPDVRERQMVAIREAASRDGKDAKNG